MNRIKTENPTEKWARAMNRQSSEENSRMIEADVKRCSSSPIMGEMKINARSHHSCPSEWQIRGVGNECQVWTGCREMQTLYTAECRMLRGIASLEGILCFNKIGTCFLAQDSTPGFVSQKMLQTGSLKENVHRGICYGG